MTMLFYFPTSNNCEHLLLSILPTSDGVDVQICAILAVTQLYLIGILIFIFLRTYDVEHFFTCLFAICISFFGYIFVKVFGSFFNQFFFSSYFWVLRFLYFWQQSIISVIFANIFLPVCDIELCKEEILILINFSLSIISFLVPIFGI